MAGTGIVAAPKNGALAPVDELSGKLALIKRTVAKDATDDELEMFLHQCRKTGLDPLARQIYCIKRGGKATIQTGIDGYRLIADRTGLYAGNDDAVFVGEHFVGTEGREVSAPPQATVTVWKFVRDERCPFTATARWSEYYPGDIQGQMWRKMPYVLLAKCAEALALRKAFPADLSGIYTDAEMHQADVEPAPAPPSRLERMEARYTALTRQAKELGLDFVPIPEGITESQLVDLGTALKDQIDAAKGAAR